jgi:hypothetical protein
MNEEVRRSLLASLAQRGYASATAALVSFPVRTPIVVVANDLGTTAVDLGELLRDETDPSELKRLAARILIGELVQCLGEQGWPSDKSRESMFRVIEAHLGWRDILGRDLNDPIERVMDSLRELSPAGGWLPSSVDDPYLVKAFQSW